MGVDFFHCVQPGKNFLLVDQRLLQKGAEHTGAHGCFGFIQDP